MSDAARAVGVQVDRQAGVVLPVVRPTASVTTRRGPRIERLDALRGLAAIMVMAHHTVYDGIWDMGPLRDVAYEGYRGVMVFFVLSGFLVALPFLRGPVGMRGYVVRRGARIVPAYVVALVGITLLSGDRQFLDDPPRFLLFLQNYDLGSFQRFLPVSWTLAIEVAFYLALPIVAILLLRAGRDAPGRVPMLLVLVGCLSFGAHLVLRGQDDPAMSFLAAFSLPAMMWAFVPGILLAWLVAARPGLVARASDPRVGIMGAVLMAVGWMAGATVLAWTLAEASLVVGTAIVIAWLIADRGRVDVPAVEDQPARPDHAGVRAFAWFGVVVSYPFYLWHYAVLRSIGDAGLRGPVAFAVAFLVTAGIGVASFRLVERPAMRAAARASARFSREPRVTIPEPAAVP
jgi:peptidoglycan/LPS O-acetylase OafA/YrhL